MFQDYLQEYPSPSQADAFLQIEEMAQRLDVYLKRYPAQYINYITSDSKFVAFVNHAIQLALNLMAYPTIWAVLLILLETQDVNALYIQVMHDYCNEYYNTKTKDYMTGLKQAAERSKLISIMTLLMEFQLQQQVHNPQMQSADQYDANAENHTQVPYHICFNDTLTKYPAWSTDTNDIENTNETQYRKSKQDILNAWQKDTPEKTSDNRQVLDDIEAYTQDRLNITQSSNHRLGLRESSLLGAQPVTAAMVQSDQLTTNIPNYLSNRLDTGRQDDYDYQDDREEDISGRWYYGCTDTN